MTTGLILLIPFTVATAFIVVLAVNRARRSAPADVDESHVREIEQQWSAPPELTRAVPRDVALSRGGKTLIVALVGGVVLTVGMSLVIYRKASIDSAQRKRLDAEGVQTDATVTRVWQTNGKSASWHVAYSFATGGRVYDATAQVNRDAYSRLAAGARIPVVYARSAPEVNRIAAAQPRPFWLALIPLFPVLMLVLVQRLFARQRSLLESGIPAGGVLTRVWRTKGGWSVRYKFHDAQGNLVRGYSDVRQRVQPELRTLVPILYDPDKPAQNTMYPVALYRIVSP